MAGLSGCEGLGERALPLLPRQAAAAYLAACANATTYSQ